MGNDDFDCKRCNNINSKRVASFLRDLTLEDNSILEDFGEKEIRYPSFIDRNLSIVSSSNRDDQGNNSSYFSKMSAIQNSIKERIEIFFSLTEIKSPLKSYSFIVKIINQKNCDDPNYLGEIKSKENINSNRIDYGGSIIADYFFEREQEIVLEPKINEEKTGNLKTFILGHLLGKQDKTLKIDFENIGILIVKCKVKERELGEDDFENQLSCFNYSIKITDENFSSSDLKDCFYVLKNFKDGGTWRPIYKSHKYSLELNKVKYLAGINIISAFLANSKKDKIKFEFYYPKINKKIPIAKAEFTLEDLERNSLSDKDTELELISFDQKKNIINPIGKVNIIYYTKKKKTFIEYIKDGMQINLDIAIDYTESNKSPDNIDSLHYINGPEPNDYEKAIKSVGEILSNYDYDQKYPVYGFGGLPGLPKRGEKVNHCFNINFEKEPFIEGIDNVIRTYERTIHNIKFTGPTFFCPVIQQVIKEIKYDLTHRKEENHYYVLLILTDGMINDKPETEDLIVEASSLPLSIIIVGIGNKDFKSMHELDGDEVPLTHSNGKIRKRDIVQFVEFNKYKNESKMVLEEAVLKEVPTQIEEYFENLENKNSQSIG